MNPYAMQARSTVAVFITACLLCVCYIFGLAVYRLYFSPLAKFPGPKLAALTRWYEFYHEVVQKGKFTFHIQDLHKTYGPIVRITPEELHIQDPEYYDELYIKSGRMDKYALMSGRFGTEESFFTTAADEHHRIRRAAINPFFSKKRIVDFQPVINAKLDKMCHQIAQFKASGREFHLHRAWTAYAGDVVTEFTFARSYDHLDSPDFKETFHEAMHAACETGVITYQFPFLWPLMNNLPDWVVLKLQPIFYLHIKVQRDFKQQITDIKEGKNEAYKNVQHSTLFHEMLQSDLPPREKTVTRLFQEAQVIIGAGILTTGWALTVASFHIINNPEIFRKLRAELVQAMPDSTSSVDWQKIEQLPYLSGCVKEGIRLSYGVASRSPRLSPKVLNYKSWVIPPRTPVSMTIVDVNHDEEIYPDSHSFIPERWLNNPKTKNGANLERYFVGFGKGSRSCIGLNLAQAEIYMGLATVFRKFSFELYETDISDTILEHDYFVPKVKMDSKGVRVKVKSIDA